MDALTGTDVHGESVPGRNGMRAPLDAIRAIYRDTVPRNVPMPHDHPVRGQTSRTDCDDRLPAPIAARFLFNFPSVRTPPEFQKKRIDRS